MSARTPAAMRTDPTGISVSPTAAGIAGRVSGTPLVVVDSAGSSGRAPATVVVGVGRVVVEVAPTVVEVDEGVVVVDVDGVDDDRRGVRGPVETGVGPAEPPLEVPGRPRRRAPRSR